MPVFFCANINGAVKHNKWIRRYRLEVPWLCSVVGVAWLERELLRVHTNLGPNAGETNS